ncbi:TetR/AcrR family transcriptional regulator [Streptomyces sp. LE64]|uniref:TetR/AcrR family transcriptional regulator n=1 Tax=Streptomyces sp. LE64 TaxID=3448653 RepID=UPI004041F07F
MPRTTDGDGAPVPSRLMAAATRLFADQGYDRTSVQEIVAAAGVTKGALYHYFGSKEDLLQEIHSRTLALQQAHLDAAAATDAPVDHRLRAVAAGIALTTIEHLDGAAIVQRSLHQLGPQKSGRIDAERRHLRERFRALVEEGQHSGAFTRETPADLVVDHHFGSVHHLPSWYRADHPLTPRQVADHLADLLLRALRP